MTLTQVHVPGLGWIWLKRFIGADANSNGGLCDRERVISLLVAVARAAYFAAEDSEEREGEDGRCHVIPGDNFDVLSDALNALDELPEPPLRPMTGPAKAEWVLRAHAEITGSAL